MLNRHPTNEELDNFLQSASPASSVPSPLHVIRHFLAGCSDCCERLKAAGWNEQRLQRFIRLSSTETEDPGYDYRISFATAERKLFAFFAVEPSPPELPERIFSEISLLSEEDQTHRASTDLRLWHPAVVRYLIDRSHDVRYEDPQRMLHLAQLARLAARACSAQSAGSAERLADLQVQAWGHLGNSLRVCGQLQEAEDALSTAQQYRRQGTGDPPLHARLLEQWASLRTFQRRFADAMALASEAGRIYRDIEQPQKLAGSLLAKAIASIYAGEAEPAIKILNQAIPLIDAEENPQLLFSACHNLIVAYIDAQKPEEALSLYFEARDLYQEVDGHTMLHLRTAWQEGQLLRDFGHLEAAEAALRRARQGFLERELFYDVAVVSLDLAAIYVRLGKVEEVRQIATETVPIFRALCVEREILGSLLQLHQAAGQEQQALELIRLLNTQLAPLSKHKKAR